MEDKNGQTIWDGDYVVGLTDSGDVFEGIVTGKHPIKPYVKIMDDNGDEVWLKSYRTEVQTPESHNYCDAWCGCPELLRRQSPVWNHHSQCYDVICDGCHKFLTVG